MLVFKYIITVWHNLSWLLDWRIVYDSYIFKYGSSNLIIFYHYTYSGLSNTMRVIIWNFIELIRNTKFNPWIDG